VLVLAAMKPASFRIERSTTINAPAARVFALINDFHNWGNWSPRETIDPAMTRSFSGSPSGVGAVYAGMETRRPVRAVWKSPRASHHRPSTSESISLDRSKHMTSSSSVPTRRRSRRVTWVMHGPTAFMTKVVRVFINMDNLIGKDFDRGLANMKDIAEKQG
jgi:hypothetical protein